MEDVDDADELGLTQLLPLLQPPPTVLAREGDGAGAGTRAETDVDTLPPLLGAWSDLGRRCIEDSVPLGEESTAHTERMATRDFRRERSDTADR